MAEGWHWPLYSCEPVHFLTGSVRGVDEERFWAVVEECRALSGGDLAASLYSLESQLARLPAGETAEFFDRWQVMGERAWRGLVWDAARVLMGWVVDDSFGAFQAWLITRGRDVFEATVGDPDNLADLAVELLATPWAVAEQFDGVVGWAACEAKGVEHPAELQNGAGPQTGPGHDRLDPSDGIAVGTRLPRVWEARRLICGR
jgi:hypothetical protein